MGELKFDERLWWYSGSANGERYGPHSERQMLAWFRESFLSSDVLVAEGDLFDGPGQLRPLAELLKERGTANPFMPASCLPMSVDGKDGVSALHHMQDEFKEMMRKFKSDSLRMTTTQLAKFTLCASKDAEMLEKRLREQIDGAKKECQEEIARAKQDIVANFHIASLNGCVTPPQTPTVPSTAPQKDWTSDWRTKLDTVADLMLSAKIESEFALQKTESIQKTVERIFERVQATPPVPVETEDYQSTLRCLWESLQKISARAMDVIERRVPLSDLAEVLDSIRHFSKMLDGLRDGLRQNPQRGGERWSEALLKVADVYNRLTELQHKLLFFGFSNAPAAKENTRSVAPKMIPANHKMHRERAPDPRENMEEMRRRNFKTAKKCPVVQPSSARASSCRPPSLLSRNMQQHQQISSDSGYGELFS